MVFIDIIGAQRCEQKVLKVPPPPEETTSSPRCSAPKVLHFLKTLDLLRVVLEVTAQTLGLTTCGMTETAM